MRRYIVIFGLVIGVGAILVIIGDSFGQGKDVLVSEFAAILILLAVAMGAGFLAALGLRAWRNARDKSDSKRDD